MFESQHIAILWRVWAYHELQATADGEYTINVQQYIAIVWRVWVTGYIMNIIHQIVNRYIANYCRCMAIYCKCMTCVGISYSFTLYRNVWIAIYCNCMTRVGAWGAVSPCGKSAWESPLAPLCQSVYHPFSNLNVKFIIFYYVSKMLNSFELKLLMKFECFAALVPKCVSPVFKLKC